MTRPWARIHRPPREMVWDEVHPAIDSTETRLSVRFQARDEVHPRPPPHETKFVSTAGDARQVRLAAGSTEMNLSARPGVRDEVHPHVLVREMKFIRARRRTR